MNKEAWLQKLKLNVNQAQRYMKPVQPDDKLAKVVRAHSASQDGFDQELWVYIRKNGLQDKKVRTQINGDEALRAVFNGKKSVSMLR